MPTDKEKKALALQKLTPIENTALGIAAGTIEVTLLQPMLYWKNAVQQGLPFTLDPRYLYRGLTMSIGNMAILTGLQFPLTGMVSKLITAGELRTLQPQEQIAASFLGGAISGFACAPMELVMIQQQRKGNSLLATPGLIVQSSGPMGLFRGLLTSCGREGVFTAGYLGLGPVFGDYFRNQRGWSEAQSKIGGAIGGGVIAATLSHPMDTIKTCMQGDIERKTYGSISQTFTKLYSEHGYQRFFTGWSFRTTRMILALFIMNECKLRLSPVFFPYHFV